jgi:hypothetical protein
MSIHKFVLEFSNEELEIIAYGLSSIDPDSVVEFHEQGELGDMPTIQKYSRIDADLINNLIVHIANKFDLNNKTNMQFSE